MECTGSCGDNAIDEVQDVVVEGERGLPPLTSIAVRLKGSQRVEREDGEEHTARYNSQTSSLAVTIFKPSSHPNPDRSRSLRTALKLAFNWVTTVRGEARVGSIHTLV
jgi:hypothetical protein